MSDRDDAEASEDALQAASAKMLRAGAWCAAYVTVLALAAPHYSGGWIVGGMALAVALSLALDFLADRF